MHCRLALECDINIFTLQGFGRWVHTSRANIPWDI